VLPEPSRTAPLVFLFAPDQEWMATPVGRCQRRLVTVRRLEDLQHLCQADARPGRTTSIAVRPDLSESRAAIERKRFRLSGAVSSTTRMTTKCAPPGFEPGE